MCDETRSRRVRGADSPKPPRLGEGRASPGAARRAAAAAITSVAPGAEEAPASRSFQCAGASHTLPCLKGRSRVRPGPTASAAAQRPLEIAAWRQGPGAACGAPPAAPRLCPQLCSLLPTSLSKTHLASAVTRLAPLRHCHGHRRSSRGSAWAPAQLGWPSGSGASSPCPVSRRSWDPEVDSRFSKDCPPHQSPVTVSESPGQLTASPSVPSTPRLDTALAGLRRGSGRQVRPRRAPAHSPWVRASPPSRQPELTEQKAPLPALCRVLSGVPQKEDLVCYITGQSLPAPPQSQAGSELPSLGLGLWLSFQ